MPDIRLIIRIINVRLVEILLRENTMKKFLTICAAGALTVVTANAIANTQTPLGLTISSTTGAIDMNCNAVRLPLSNPQTLGWYKMGPTFGRTNLQCTFNLHNNPTTEIASANVMIWASSVVPGRLSGVFQHVESMNGYPLPTIIRTGHAAHMNAFYRISVAFTGSALKVAK